MSVRRIAAQRFLYTNYLCGELFGSADRYRLFREKILPKLLGLRSQLESLYCESNGRLAIDICTKNGIPELASAAPKAWAKKFRDRGKDRLLERATEPWRGLAATTAENCSQIWYTLRLIIAMLSDNQTFVRQILLQIAQNLSTANLQFSANDRWIEVCQFPTLERRVQYLSIPGNRVFHS
jgi:hypothetical protein